MTLSLDLLLGFALFALVTSITPGPEQHHVAGIRRELRL